MADRPNIDSEAIRVHVVLRSTPGLTVEEIHARLRARHYLAEPRDVIEALARHFNEFRHEQRDGATLWYALHAQFPITMPRPPRRADPPAWAPPPRPIGLRISFLPQKAPGHTNVPWPRFTCRVVSPRS